MTTGKTIALTRWTFVSKVMSLLFITLYCFSSKEQVSFNFMATVTVLSDFGAQENKVCHCFYFVAGVQLPSRVRLFATPQTAAGQASLSFTISWSLVKLMFIESVMLSSHLIL